MAEATWLLKGSPADLMSCPLCTSIGVAIQMNGLLLANVCLPAFAYLDKLECWCSLLLCCRKLVRNWLCNDAQDVKSPNVLLAADYTAKISDVGLAKLQNKGYLSAQQQVGTFTWSVSTFHWRQQGQEEGKSSVHVTSVAWCTFVCLRHVALPGARPRTSAATKLHCTASATTNADWQLPCRHQRL